MIKDLHNHILYTSVSRNQLPSNLKSYNCDLVFQQDLQTSKTKKYLLFRSRDNKNQPSFKIVLSSFKKPSNLMHIYRIDNQKFTLKGKIQKVGEARVQKKVNQFKYKDINEDDDEYVQKIIVFGDQSSQFNSDDDSYDSQSSSIGVAPTSEQTKNKIKSAIIEILNKRQRVSSIKELNSLLKKQAKIKIPQNSAKQLALKVCVTEKKSKGYSLKPQYIDYDEKMEGRKRIKGE